MRPEPQRPVSPNTAPSERKRVLCARPLGPALAARTFVPCPLISCLLRRVTDTAVPEPFDFAPWVSAHAAELSAGRSLRLFGEDHPDKEFDVRVIGGPSKQQVELMTVDAV